jgi:hypothetical protein
MNIRLPRFPRRAARDAADGGTGDEQVVIGPEKARQGTSNPMTARILILSLVLVFAGMFAGYAIFAL